MGPLQPFSLHTARNDHDWIQRAAFVKQHTQCGICSFYRSYKNMIGIIQSWTLGQHWKWCSRSNTYKVTATLSFRSPMANMLFKGSLQSYTWQCVHSSWRVLLHMWKKSFKALCCSRGGCMQSDELPPMMYPQLAPTKLHCGFWFCCIDPDQLFLNCP